MTPTPIILDCDPGHDDAIAILLALASPELELVGVTTVSGNQTLDKTTANALRVLELAGRGDIPVYAGADAPFIRGRDVAAHVHGESGLDGPDLPPASSAPQRAARGRVPRRPVPGGTEGDARRDRPADERRPRVCDPRRRAARPDRPDGRRGRGREPHAGGRVQHLGRPRGRPACLRGEPRHDDGRARRDPPGADHRRAHRADAQRQAASGGWSPS